MTQTVSCDVRFAVATANDDPAIRQLLRDNPTNGDVALSFEREPDYFAGANLAGSEDQTIVAYDGNKLVCMGQCSVRERFINGKAQRVGYLSQLRLDKSARGRFDSLRRGYEFFRQQNQHKASFFFTSIATDNERSRRLLEANVRGMPEYRLISDFTTALIPVPKRQKFKKTKLRRASSVLNEDTKIERADLKTLAAVVDFLNGFSSRHHLATHWTAERLLACNSVGLRFDDIYVLRHSGRIRGCIALWDQRCFRQLVVRGYSSKLSILKPIINLGALALQSIELPDIGQPIRLAYASPFAVDEAFESKIPLLIDCVLAEEDRRGMDSACVWFKAGDQRWKAIGHFFETCEYNSRLYQVTWPGENNEIRFDDRAILPELAFL